MASVIASGQARALETVVETLTVEESIAATALVEVENLLGSVEIKGGRETGKIRIEARVVAEAKSEDEARALAESIRLDHSADAERTWIHVAYPVERLSVFRRPKAGLKGLLKRWAAPVLRGKSVAVEYDGRHVEVTSDRKAAGVAVHLTVTLPYGIRSSFRQAVGSVRCAALRGHMSVEIREGDIHIERYFGVLEARAAGGSVEVVSFQGERLNVETTSGNMQLTEIRADDAHVRSNSGAIHIAAMTAKQLLVESVSGSVKMDGAEAANLDVKTGSGDVNLATRLQRTGQVVIESASGDVTLRVGRLTYFQLEAETKSGQVKTLGVSLDVIEENGSVVKLRRGRGGGGADVRVVAAGGSLVVRPYDASRLDILLGDHGT